MNQAHSSHSSYGLFSRATAHSASSSTGASRRKSALSRLLLSALFASVCATASAQPAPILTTSQTKAPASQIVAQVSSTTGMPGAETGLSIEQRSVYQRDSRRFIRMTSLDSTVAPTHPRVLAAKPKSQSVAKTSVVSQSSAWKNGSRIASSNTNAQDKAAEQTAKTTTVETPLSTLPPAKTKAQVLPKLQQTVNPTPKQSSSEAALAVATLPGLNSFSQIVQVQALKLPPVSQPLPQWMQNVSVPMDGQFLSVPLPASTPATKASGARVAQNPAAPPLRQPQRPITSSDRLPNQIEVAASTYIVLVTTVDLATVAVADPNIADVAVVNARAILVNGKASGTTTLVVVDRLGTIRQYQVAVVAAPGTRPIDIEDEIGIAGVTVRRLQNSIILEGDVASADEMKRALEIAGIFSENVVNQLRVRDTVDLGQLTALQIQEALARPDMTVRIVGKTAILDGTAANESERQRAEQIARAYSEGEVLNLLRLPSMSVDDLRNMLGGVEAGPEEEMGLLGLGTIGTARPPQRLVVRRVGDQVVLEGILQSQAEIDAALAAASRTGLQVVNRLLIAPAPPEEAALLNRVAAAIGLQGVRVRGTAKRLVLEGIVPDSNSAVRAGQIALGFADDVDNMLDVLNPTQINVEVSIVEINKNDFKNLGVSFPGLADGSVDFSGGTALGGVGGGIGIGEGVGGTNLGTSFETRLRAQLDRGNAQLLANPRATVLSGRTASFQAGGQIPVPASAQVTGTGLTTIEVEFKDFGVLMDVTPVANNDGVITLRVRTDITQLDANIGSITVAPGISIPAFTRRAAVTEVTTRSGDTIALSGLISNEIRKAIREIPFLSKIPILGKLFTSKRYLRNESDLVIFVTPRVLPNVLREGEVAPSSPIAVGPSTIAPTIMGNPGIQTFSTIGGAGVQPESGGGGNAGN